MGNTKRASLAITRNRTIGRNVPGMGGGVVVAPRSSPESQGKKGCSKPMSARRRFHVPYPVRLNCFLFTN